MSRWVDEEIVRFSALKGNSRILTVILDGDPLDPQQICFPPALLRNNDKGDAGHEPIAADLRPHRDGERVARLKLLAGMLGVGLDELVRRDTQRRHRRLLAITAASLLALVVTAGLAIAALIARDEAQTQRAHAEGLIEFMLTDLRRKLEPGGKLDAMDGVGYEALKYYGSQKTKDLDAESLGRSARALRLVGEIRVQRGDLAAALKSFQQAAATTQELMSRTPADGRLIFNHAQNIFWVGEIARQRGDIPAAEASFRQYGDLAQSLVRIDPVNVSWKTEPFFADVALGTLFLQEGRSQEAIAVFKSSLSAIELLAARYSDDQSLQIDVAQAHAWLTDALQKSGRLSAARRHGAAELQIYQSLLAKDATFRPAKFSSIDVLLMLGRLAQYQGNDKESLSYLQEATRQAEAMLSSERDNMDLTAVTAIANVALGEMLLAESKVDDASAAQRRGAELVAMALSHDGQVLLWRNYQCRARLLEAAVLTRGGHPGRALAIDDELLQELQTQPSTSANTDAFWLLQTARLQAGDNRAALGRLSDAREHWESILGSLREPLSTYEPKLIQVAAAAQSRLGKREEADKLLARLVEASSGGEAE